MCATASAQEKKAARDLPRNDPSACPYCLGDPERMRAAGIVSHGGFEFGVTNTAEIDAELPTSDIRWIESKHFEIGFALPPIRVSMEEKDKIRAELARLAPVLFGVPEKPTVLDPWLRAHLYAQRCEDLWTRMLALLEVDESDFPDGTKLWDMAGKYMGEGPYLGEKGKYEVMLLPSEASFHVFLKEHYGVVTKLSQRYNCVDRDSIIIAIHTQQEGLRVDEALHGHLVFNLSQNLMDGYKHYSYNLPIWLREGVSHYLEREINPKFNTFDASEGALAEETRKENWQPPTLKLVRSGNAPRMAELVAMKDFADVTLERHFATWSMIDYLLHAKPGFFAKLLDGMKGITNTHGIADGSNLPEVQREIFKNELGMTYAQFDDAWQAWVSANYAVQ
jgi:hypothetical protein